MMAKKIKKRYQKPLINRVNLVSEEAVLTACKTSAGEDKTNGSNKKCGHPSGQCADVGS